MRFRPLELPTDRAGVIELAESVAVTDGQAPLSEHKYAQVAQLGHIRVQGIVAEDDGGSLVGYAAIVPASVDGEWGLELALSPPARTDETIGGLVRAARRAVIELGGERLRLWLYTDDLVDNPEKLGFAPERQLLRMRRPLPAELKPEFPESVTVRGFRPGVDEERWLAVNNAAFFHHPENGGWALNDLEERMAMRWFDPEGFRLAWEGDDLAGFCWTKIHPDGSGEIYVIAVAPGHQGRGLGRMLVLEGTRHLSRVGAPEVFLYCEAANQAARELYERLGFAVERVHRAFIADLVGHG